MNVSIKKMIISIIIFMVLSLFVVYAEEPDKKQEQRKVEQRKSQNSQLEINKKQTKPPAEFIPSEKIKSDGFVSFPVDI